MGEIDIQFKFQKTQQKLHKFSSITAVLTVRIFPKLGLSPEGPMPQTPQARTNQTLQTGKSQAAPLTSWLRIPLSWYASHTISFFPDETHASIRRTYTSPSQPTSKRHFCGFCGTPLSFWTESPSSEASFISLTLGSLTSDDLRDLEELGLLPEEALADAENDRQTIEEIVPRSGGVDETEGLPWFEKMVEGSRLGNMRRHSREVKGWKVEWEIVEWTDGDEVSGTTTGGKRKLGDVLGNNEDIRME